MIFDFVVYSRRILRKYTMIWKLPLDKDAKAESTSTPLIG